MWKSYRNIEILWDSGNPVGKWKWKKQQHENSVGQWKPYDNTETLQENKMEIL